MKRKSTEGGKKQQKRIRTVKKGYSDKLKEKATATNCSWN